MEREHELGGQRWTEVAAAPGGALLVPLGSLEQHGPHLPLDTDTRIAGAIARRVAARRRGVMVAPPVAYGASGEHQAFPGTLSIGTDVLTTVLVELGRSAFPGDRPYPYGALVFVNGHGGNLAALRRALGILRDEGRPVSSWTPTVPAGDAHAGRTETSLLLAIDADVVGPERPVGNTAPIVDLMGELRAGNLASVAPSGVLGDATESSVDEGHRILAALVAELDRRVDEALAMS